MSDSTKILDTLIGELKRGTLVLSVLLSTSNLYLTYAGPVGFRMVFIIVAVIGTLETISGLWKFVKYYVMGE